MAAPSLPIGSTDGRRTPGTPAGRVPDAAATPRCRCAAPPTFPPLMWAAAVLVMAGVAAVCAEGVPEPSLPLHLPLGTGRAWSSLYRSTVQYLMNRLAPSRHSERWVTHRMGPRPHTRLPQPRPHKGVGHKGQLRCLGAVYRRTSGGSKCVSTFTAATVVSVVLLLKLLFYLAVFSACPAISSSLTQGRNITNVFNIEVTNGVNMDTMSEAQMQMQTQTLDQEQYQDLYQLVDPELMAAQDADVVQDQYQDQYQEFTGRALDWDQEATLPLGGGVDSSPSRSEGLGLRQTQEKRDPTTERADALGETRRKSGSTVLGGGGRGWSLSSFNLCPLLSLYLTR